MGKRVLIISAKVGAGHMRAAAAIEAALKERHPDVECRNIEALEYTNAAYAGAFQKAYEKLAADLPSIWEFIYETLESKPAKSKTKKLTTLFDRMNLTALRSEVEDWKPDAVVCTHYLPAEVFGPRKRKGRLFASLSVVLTDFDIHTMWIQPGVDRYFVATDEMEYALRAKGIGNAAVSVTGIPIMPVFSKVYDKAAMRAKLGLKRGAPTVLLAAGGFGLMAVEETADVLAKESGDVQFVAIAGRNEKLQRRLDKVARRHRGKVIALGFVTNMHEYMAASDFVVAKSGGLTSSECLAMGLPMVIWNPIPGQEERNADYLLENGAALMANSPAHLVFRVKRLLDRPDLLAKRQAAARAIARPMAAYDIAREVLEMS